MHSIFSKKNIAMLCLFCLTVTLLCGAGLAPESDEPVTEAAAQDAIPLYVDGIRVGDGVLMDSTTYVPLRAFCRAMGRDLHMDWDEETQTMTVTLERDIELHPQTDWDVEEEEELIGPGEPIPAEEEGETVRKSLLLTAACGDAYLTANGRCIWAPAGLRMADDKLMAPIRALAEIFDLDVIWHDDTRSVSLDSRQLDILEDAESYYDEDDLYWLSHIIYAESGNQPLEGMIGVGNVVLNRVESDMFPDTIFDVVFDTQNGVQFSPVIDGTIYKPASDRAVIAACLCLEGYSTVGDSLFFVAPSISDISWLQENYTYVTTIGGHMFYK
jgi:N-acetylmuramoyl-L-alanine amidase